MLLLDFCNIKEWNCQEILSFYKKHRIIHSPFGLRGGFEKYCISKYSPTKTAYAMVEASEIEPWLSEENEIVTPAMWLGVDKIIFPSNSEHSKIWQSLRFSKDDIFAPFLNKCAAGTLDLNFVNDQLEDFQEIGFSLAFPGKIKKDEYEEESGIIKTKKREKNKDAWKLKTGIVWNFKTEYLRTLEDYIDWEILSLFLYDQGSILKRVHQCEWSECGAYFLRKRNNHKYCSDSCSSNMRSFRWRETGKANEYMREYMRKGRKEGKYI